MRTLVLYVAVTMKQAHATFGKNRSRTQKKRKIEEDETTSKS
jgi:hypothetical protein